MGSPISGADNPAVNELQHTGYDIQLYVDGVEVQHHRLSRTHLKIEGDEVTLSGSAILKLHQGDVVQLRLKPKGLRPKKYRIRAGGAVLTAQLLRWY